MWYDLASLLIPLADRNDYWKHEGHDTIKMTEMIKFLIYENYKQSIINKIFSRAENYKKP